MEIISVYFSTGGESEKVALYYKRKLLCSLYDLTSKISREQFDFDKHYDLIILSFPVFSQNIPNPLKNILSKLNASYFIINITYGKMSFGNSLKNAEKLLKGKIIGASLIPAKHTYLNMPSITPNDLNPLDQIISLIPLKQDITIPKFYRHPLANFFPTIRSQMGIKISKISNCENCNLCMINCPTGSILYGKIKGHKCIRCLKCVNVCPNKVLQSKMSNILKYYLRKKRDNRLLIFTSLSNPS